MQPKMLFDVNPQIYDKISNEDIFEEYEPEPTEEEFEPTEIPVYKTRPTSSPQDYENESSFLGWSHQLQAEAEKNKNKGKNWRDLQGVQIVENTGGKWVEVPTERPVVETFTFKARVQNFTHGFKLVDKMSIAIFKFFDHFFCLRL